MKTTMITTHYPELEDKAKALAATLLLPFNQADADFSLILTPDYLGLQNNHDQASTPFYIDFNNESLAYRLKHAGKKNEMLLRAMGASPKDNPFILDATAGTGRDAFLLAHAGFHLTLLERSPILYALLDDALKRAACIPALEPMTKRLSLIHADACTHLKALTPKPDIIYLDPMFPPRRKSALVKKEMVLLHELLGSAEDESELLHAALACAKKRIVVKRPRLAPPLDGKTPHFSLEGKSSRFDIYLQPKMEVIP